MILLSTCCRSGADVHLTYFPIKPVIAVHILFIVGGDNVPLDSDDMHRVDPISRSQFLRDRNRNAFNFYNFGNDSVREITLLI